MSNASARPRVVLTDIEGTTTSISFVHDVLFPYSRANLADFVRARGREPEVRAALEAAARVGGLADGASDDAIVDLLRSFIDADKKEGSLKTLQGLQWRDGYERGDFVGHLYDDVAPALRRWRAAGIRLAVYSSGSVAAQHLLFGHSSAGDLQPLFDGWFDTRVGGKREAPSYLAICAALDVAPAEITFLSDIEAELDAAASVGVRAIQLLRAGTAPSARHVGVADFDAVGALLTLD